MSTVPGTVIQRSLHHSPDELRLAAIDVGSNSIHMAIAQAAADDALTTLWRAKEMVGLGRMSFPSRRLSGEAMERAIVTLRRFLQEAQHRQCELVLAVATSAVREAENGGAFIDRVRNELGLHIRVVSARGEAELIYLGVRHAMGLEQGPHLIIDIGGGSVEFIVGDHQKADLLESRKLGAARMTARFIRSDPASPDELRALLRHYDQELTPLMAAITRLSPIRVIGTSGTLENLALMCGGDDGNGAAPTIRRDALDALAERLIESRSRERARIRGLDDQRKDQILAGALLAREIFHRLDIRQMVLCRSAMREGILIQYLSQHRPELEIRRDVPDPRKRSIADLARRCHANRDHARQVCRLCLRLFDQLRGLHGLDRHARELIEYGSMLHDIGFLIGRDKHHKHAAYLIRNGGLQNFSQEEISIIACIARYHRGPMPRRRHRQFSRLSEKARRIVWIGGALLRLADGLDRTNCAVVEDLRCRVGRRKVRVLVRTRGDAELEVWSANARCGMFEKAFGRGVVFESRRR